jgi:transcriptional regulatory protein LEU3
MSILAFQLLGRKDEIDYAKMLRLSTITHETIQHIARVDEEQPSFSSYLAYYFARMVNLAANLFLRLVKSPLRDQLNLDDSEASFFASLHILKKISMQDGDVEIRTINALTPLWTSTRVFRRGKGPQNGLQLSMQHRLVSFFSPLASSSTLD